jgi:hypothetical protein
MARSMKWVEKRRRKAAIRVRLLSEELAKAATGLAFWTRTLEIERRRKRPHGVWAILDDIQNRIAQLRRASLAD